jgi:POT family proton-dependent oligopeptide transporter
MSQTNTGHPKGLYVLFTTEMWERFNFYGMRAILSLFMAQALMMGEKDSSIIYGGFLGLCYLTPLLGGYIADKFLGNRICILLGGLLMAIGQFTLFASASSFQGDLNFARTLMWSGLLILIIGNGFFKPNISSMVGQLYPPAEKNKLDSAFTIFYLGINVGATLGIFICPLLGDVKDAAGVRDLTAFKYGFLAAGIAMLLACIVFYLLKDKYVVTPDGEKIGDKPDRKKLSESGEQQAKFTTQSVITTVVMMIALTFGFHYLSIDADAATQNPIKVWLFPFIYSAGLSLAFLIISDKSLTKIERDRILVLYIVAFFVIFFWAAFEQAGSSLTFIADKQTDTSIFGWNMPPSMVQNFNSIFVIALAIPFSLIWAWMAKKGIEPISPVKQSWGLAFIALGYLIIAFQVKDLGVDGKIGVVWLAVLYLLHTVGELCLSPIGLSLVAKLSPVRFSSLLMGVWFISNAAGYALTGTLGALLPPTGDKYQKAQELGIDLNGVLNGSIIPNADQMKLLADNNLPAMFPKFAGFQITNLYEFFMLFVILPGVASVLLLALTPIMKKLMHGVK